MTQPKGSYLIKLLILLVKKSGGMIKVPSADLFDEDLGQGIQVHFDHQSRELVITHVPAGAQTYKVEESMTWLTSSLIPSSTSPQSPRTLTREDLIEKVFVNRESPDPVDHSMDHREREKRNKVVTLSDESLAAAEAEKYKQSLLKDLQDYQPSRSMRDSPRQTTRSSTPMVSMFSKP